MNGLCPTDRLDITDFLGDGEREDTERVPEIAVAREITGASAF